MERDLKSMPVDELWSLQELAPPIEKSLQASSVNFERNSKEFSDWTSISTKLSLRSALRSIGPKTKAVNLLTSHVIVSQRLKEASMRIRKITFTETAVALAFGLAVLFWWEVAEPIRSTGWRGSAEQWLALASVGIGVCATLVAVGGALFALSKTRRWDE